MTPLPTSLTQDHLDSFWLLPEEKQRIFVKGLQALVQSHLYRLGSRYELVTHAKAIPGYILEMVEEIERLEAVIHHLSAAFGEKAP